MPTIPSGLLNSTRTVLKEFRPRVRARVQVCDRRNSSHLKSSFTLKQKPKLGRAATKLFARFAGFYTQIFSTAFLGSVNGWLCFMRSLQPDHQNADIRRGNSRNS